MFQVNEMNKNNIKCQYNLKQNKNMIASNQKIVSDINKSIFENLEKQITTIQKVNKIRQPYSALKVLHILGQVQDHLMYSPQVKNQLKTPTDCSSIQFDNFTSVYSVMKQQKNRSLQSDPQLKRKNYSQISHQSQQQQKNKKSKFNKIKELDSQIHIKQSQQQIQQNKFRQRLQKQRQKLLQIAQDANNRNNLKKEQIKESLGYDYDSNRFKLKVQIKNNLISSNKSLIAQVSQNVIRKESPFKISSKKQNLQTRPVQQKKKAVVSKSTRISTLPIETNQNQHASVQFSKIRTLTQTFNCEPGVSFQFENQFLNGTKKIIDFNNRKENKKPFRLTKLEYMILKERSKSSTDQIKEKNRITSQIKRQSKQASQALENKRAHSTSFRLMTLQSAQSTHRVRTQISNKNHSIIEVPSKTMHQYLLASQKTQRSQRQDEIQKYTSSQQLQTKSQIVLDDNDLFNIKYLKGGVHNYKTQTNTNRETKQMQSTLSHIKERRPFIKVRQKINRRNNNKLDFKKKFQQTLRSNQFLTC